MDDDSTPGAQRSAAPSTAASQRRPGPAPDRGPVGLAPARPWQRDDPNRGLAPQRPRPAPSAPSLDPVRPWDEPADSGRRDDTDASPALGRLRRRRRASGESVPAVPRHAAIVGRGPNVAPPAAEEVEADVEAEGVEADVEADSAPLAHSVLRRAVHWITARAPAPGQEPALAELPPMQVPTADEAPVELVSTEELSAPPVPADPVDPDLERPAQPEPIDRPPRTRGLLARFRREKDTENDVDDTFTLPEAGAALASAWAQPADELRPTRDWSSRSPLRPRVDVMSETPPAEPAPTSEGQFRSRPRPVAAQPPPPPAPPPPAPPPQAATEAGESGTSARPRPRPRPASERGSDPESGDGGRIGIAGAAAAAAAAPVGLAALRNSPPASTSDKAADASTPALSGRADSDNDGIGRNYQPDISRFLKATEPQPGDDHKREDDPRARSGNDHKGIQEDEERQKGEEPQEGEEPQKADRKPNFLRRHPKAIRRSIRLLVVVAIAVGAAVLLRIFVVQPYYIPSESMEPTLHGCANCNDDRVLVDKLSYRAHDARSNDIVVFRRPAGDASPENVLIKRVVALPDDTVSLKKGDVYVNGLPIGEPYLNKKCGPHPSKPLTGRSVWKVPSGSVFVLGDNRCNSRDSRAFGPIPASSVVGKAFAIYWPLNRITLL